MELKIIELKRERGMETMTPNGRNNSSMKEPRLCIWHAKGKVCRYKEKCKLGGEGMSVEIRIVSLFMINQLCANGIEKENADLYIYT